MEKNTINYLAITVTNLQTQYIPVLKFVDSDDSYVEWIRQRTVGRKEPIIIGLWRCDNEDDMQDWQKQLIDWYVEHGHLDEHLNWTHTNL